MSIRRVPLFLLATMILAALASILLWPHKLRPGRADEPPPKITLAGIVRDFSASHPDFDVTPAEGFGHFADVVTPWVDSGGVPTLRTTGYLVKQQWRDQQGRPIAPHLAGLVDPFSGGDAGAQTLGARVDEKIDLKKESTADAFSSVRGPYGENRNYGFGAYLSTNSTEKDHVDLDSKSLIHGAVMVGPGGDPDRVIKGKGMVGGAIGTLTTAEAMPQLACPDDLAIPYVDHYDLDGAVTWTGDLDPDDLAVPPALHFGELHVKKDATVLVEGDMRVVCDKKFKWEGASLQLLPEATLTVYVRGDVEFKKRTLINTVNPDTTAVVINVLGRHKVEIEDKSHVYATIIAPESKIEIEKESHLYGGVVGREMKFEDRAGFHADTANASVAPWNFAVTVREKIEVDDKSEIDGFDSNLGPYGEGNQGIEALLITNSIEKEYVKIKDDSVVTADVVVGYGGDPNLVIEVDKSTLTGTRGHLAETVPVPVVVPPLMGERVDEVKFKNGSYTLSNDVYCKKFKVEKKANLEIIGDVTVRADDSIEIEDDSHVTLTPGSTLTLYFGKEMKVHERSSVNVNTGNPQLVSIRRMTLGKGKIEIKKESQVVAWVQGAQTEMKVEDKSEFFGSFTGKELKVKKSKFHVDMAYLNSCLEIDDTVGERGDDGRGGITSAESFDQWFRTAPGVNRSAVHRITLTRRADGAYEYIDDAFHPIDDRLMGNEGEPHNHFLTYAIKADFRYTSCTGGWLEFEGGDGVWAFVDGRLAIDLGGMRPGTSQRLEVDRLGLSDGTHRLELFYAQRTRETSDFRLRTNLQVDTSRVVPGGSYD